MIKKENQQKIKHFYQTLAEVQPQSGKDIGLIIIKEETLADLIELTENSNLTATFDLKEDTSVPQFLEDLSKAFNHSAWVFIRLHSYLDPAVYNQLYLISHSGRLHFFKLEEEILLDLPKRSQLILVSTDDEIERLNYKNLFEIVGPILRLE